jgi:hypothetical protein
MSILIAVTIIAAYYMREQEPQIKWKYRKGADIYHEVFLNNE